MMDWLAIISSITAPLLVLGAVFNFSVIKPLNAAIKSLNEAIAAMRAQLHEVDEKRQYLAERVAKAESAAASAHHRIDGLETRIHYHEHRQN